VKGAAGDVAPNSRGTQLLRANFYEKAHFVKPTWRP
jgi:hypothetical protein